ncbi:uncharacterized protein LOC129838474 isoform X1 [Salvelinus fontinalis]|uniref:uncharacterized protein LOC129838474 isoform X1 n=1 Tax=Salvelinus fontinalis TaxID=8038 RepID=UPI0024861E8B|nr:uncharacterized protein LOC129838474 isoform X1 [Salvelinus fontinalis]
MIIHMPTFNQEFFENKKMQRKMETLGIPTSPEGASSGSMYLVTLFIVNQIAAKKENNDQPKITRITDDKGGPKSMREGPLKFPITSFPCGEPAFVQVWFIDCCSQLSPVLESNMSDTSTSDYQQHITLSPFSSASSSVYSSGADMFSLQQRAQVQPQPHCSPRPPWDISTSEQPQPGGRRECASWATGPSGPKQQLSMTPPVSKVWFGGTEPEFPTALMSAHPGGDLPADVSSACPGNTHHGPKECWESSPSYSPRGGCFISDADDDEVEDYHQCQQVGSSKSHSERSCIEEIPVLSQASSHWNTQQRGHPQSQPRPYTPPTRPQCTGHCGNDQRDHRDQRGLESFDYTERRSGCV